VAYAIKTAPSLPKDYVMVVNLSGRGDKDLHTIANIDQIKL
jgi:tryptophan synthase beta chain